MTVSSIKVHLPYPACQVWKVVADVKHYTWRSDLSKTEVISDSQFVEYTKKGYPTSFSITVSEPCKRWEFDMENSNMKGHWVGIFLSRDSGTEIEFTEYITVKKFFMKPFARRYLQKQQALFVEDLKRALAEQGG